MKRILIVDPIPNVRDFLREKLSAPNVEVKVAPSGEKAFERMRFQDFDLIVASLEMPPPNAADLIRHLRDAHSDIPVIAMSSTCLDDTGARQKVLELGAFTYVEKPVILNRLYEAIETCLDFKIEGNERRRYPRIPIYLDLLCHGASGDTSLFSHPLHTMDISLGGLSFERPVPAHHPFPYERGKVHPDHPFHRYSIFATEPAPMHLTLSLSRGRMTGPAVLWAGRTISIQGHVAHVIGDPAHRREYVGVRFRSLSAGDREKLKNYLRQLADEMTRMDNGPPQP